MIKVLIKKQFRELFSMYMRKNNNKKTSKKNIIFYAILMIYCVVVFFGMFYSLMNELGPVLFSADMGWLYFAFSAIIATVLAVVGSVFMAQSQLYGAKDNDFLLSLPIPPSKILFSRLMSLYMQNFLFETLVFLPTIIVYFKIAAPSAVSILFCVILLFLLPVLSLTLTCILGWIVALISARVRNKSLMTVVLSLGFFGVYFYFFAQLNQNIQRFIANSQVIGEKIKASVYPLYQMGLGAQGDVKCFIIFTVIVTALFSVVYIALSKSFIHIATAKRGAKKIRYKEKVLKVSSSGKALYGKEVSRFLRSPIYILNCGLGTVMIIVMAVALILKRNLVLDFVEQIPELKVWAALISCAVLCVTSSMNVVTSPSVSLEGKTLWIVQSLPIKVWQILCAKLKLHMIVTAPAAVFCAIVMAVIFKASPIMSLVMIITPVMFVFLIGELGLLFNLKFPKLDWSSEAMAVKQSLSVLLTIFTGWGIVAVFVIAYLKLNEYINPELYVTICISVMAVISVLLAYWLKNRGTKILERL